MAEHLSVSEIEGEAKNIKRDLEAWREIILPINSVLLWEKNSYLGIILATTSVLFLILWQMDPSILTLVSFLGIIITVIDYLVPTLTLHFCHPEKWTSTQERKLESICRTLAANKIYLINSFKSFYQMRRDRPTFYYTIVILSLLMLSWIGNTVNNLFLTYLVDKLVDGCAYSGMHWLRNFHYSVVTDVKPWLDFLKRTCCFVDIDKLNLECQMLQMLHLIVTGMLLFPGIQQRGLIEKYAAQLQDLIKEKVGSAKTLKSE